MLINKTVSIPGIEDNSQFQQTLLESGITVHPSLSIAESTTGGIGLFFNHQVSENSTLSKVNDNDTPSSRSSTFSGLVDSCIELARIPKRCTFSLETTLSLLEDAKVYESQFDDLIIVESEMIKNFLILNQPDSELEILKSYILGFYFTNSVEKLLIETIDDERKSQFKQYVNGSPFRKLDAYMKVLLHTKVNTIDNDSSEALENALEIYKNYKVIEINIAKILQERELEYPKLINGLKEKLSPLLEYYIGNIDYNSFLPVKIYHQLNSAIKSRVLEIPQAITSELNDENDDFTVNSTLVPLLDFANHSNNPDEKNAYFDIDRSNNDILLIYEPPILPNFANLKVSFQEKTTFKSEIFISYTPTEDVFKMFTTYGFIPQDQTQEKLFEVSIEERSLSHPSFHCTKLPDHADMILKWLHILPNIQFVFKNVSKPKLNYDANLLPLIFSNLKYNTEWYLKLVDSSGKEGEVELKENADVKDEDMVENIRQLREYEMSIGSFIVNLPQVAVSLDLGNDETIFPIHASEVLDVLNHDKIEECFVQSTTFIRNYCRWRVCQLKQFIHDFRDDSYLFNLVDFEVDLLSAFTIEENYSGDEIYDLDQCKAEWVDFRYKPVINFSNLEAVHDSNDISDESDSAEEN